jgi:hypothetical protein
MFGITLTRLRSRLRPQTMTDLAELRMYLRDEHIKSGELKERLRKRTMTSHHAESEGGAPSNMAAVANTDSDDDEVESFITETTTPNSGRTSLCQIIERLTPRRSNDCTAPEDSNHMETSDDEEDSTVPGLTPIRDLFNFQNDTWTRIAKAISMRGLEDEMELYDLVDLDAAGEDDEGQEGGSMLDDEFVASSLNLDS